MAVFEIQGPDGTTYEVEAGSIEEAARAVSQMQPAQPGVETGAEAPGPASSRSGVAKWLKENLLGDDDPTTQNLGETVGSLLNKGGEAMTFGLIGDETSAAVESILPGVSYDDRRDHYRGQEELLREKHPGLTLGAEVGGAVLPAVLTGGAGLVANAPNLGSRMLMSGLAAGTGAGTYGFMEGEGGIGPRAGDAANAAKWGFGIGAAVPLAGAAVQKFADNRAARRAIKEGARGAPGTDELRAIGQGLYQEIDDAGVRLRPERVAGLYDDIATDLAGEGAALRAASGANSPIPATASAYSAARELSEEAGGKLDVPFRDLDMARRFMGNTAASNLKNPGDTRGATRAITSMDDFIRGLTLDDVTGGDIKALQSALPKARDVWARMSRSQLIDDAIANGSGDTGSYLSGGASGIRNQFARILRNDKLSRGFSEAEKAAMARVVNGGALGSVVHNLGSGLGQIATTTLGTAGGAVAPGVGPLAGFMGGAAVSAGTRKASEALARSQAETVRALIANGGLKQLPSASPAVRNIVEEMLRRNLAVAAN